MWPIPAAWQLSPVSRMARVGEHIGLTWKLVKRTPSAARRSRFGVEISQPKQPMSLNPTSSTSTNTMFGAPGGAVGGSGHHGSLFTIVRRTTPSNPG